MGTILAIAFLVVIAIGLWIIERHQMMRLDKLWKGELMNPDDDGKICVDWRGLFDAQQLREIDWALLCGKDFNHGTVDHNQLVIIAQMAKMIDDYCEYIKEHQEV